MHAGCSSLRRYQLTADASQVENKYPTALGGMFGVPEEGVLTVVKADGLKQSDMYDGADPYCKVSSRPSLRFLSLPDSRLME